MAVRFARVIRGRNTDCFRMQITQPLRERIGVMSVMMVVLAETSRVVEIAPATRLIGLFHCLLYANGVIPTRFRNALVKYDASA